MSSSDREPLPDFRKIYGYYFKLDDDVRHTADCPFCDDKASVFTFNTQLGQWSCDNCGKGNLNSFREKYYAKHHFNLEYKEFLEKERGLAFNDRHSLKSDNLLMDPNLLFPDGVLGDIVTWMCETAIMPQPEISLAAAITFMGTIVGRKVRSETDLRTNVYCIGVGETGCGKNHPRVAIKNLAMAAGLAGDMLGGEEISSDAGLLSAVFKRPSVLFPLDEIGHFFKQAQSHNAAPYMQAIPTTLTKLFTSASNVYLGKEYADQKTNPRKDIVQPNASIFGTTTPLQLLSALTPSEIENGLLGRMMLFIASNNDPIRQNVVISPPPKSLVKWCIDWFRRTDQPKAPGNLAEVAVNIPFTMTQSDEAKKILAEYYVYSDREKRKLRDGSGLDALWARSAEYAIKFAMIQACGRMFLNPVIDAEAMEYGTKLARYLTNQLVKSARSHIVDNDWVREQNFVLQRIRDAGVDGISQSALYAKTRRLKKRDRIEILEGLLMSEMIEKFTYQTARGREGVRWRISS